MPEHLKIAFRIPDALLLTLVLVLGTAPVLAAEDDEPDEPEAAAGQEEAPATLRADLAYWRGAVEETPGPFLCPAPAATGVTVTCDRWPDTTDLRQFALDAFRLSGAKTEEDQALAVWRWLRRIKVHTDGNAPTETLAQKDTSYVTDPLKVMNVYGAHFCGGLSRVAELVWRAAGRRADRTHVGSHSMVELFYRDRDGAPRYHLFDVNFGGFAEHSSRQRIMGVNEWTTDYDGGKAIWIHCEHWPWPKHRMDLAFRPGERLERVWGNWGKPYQDHMDLDRDKRRTPLAERGPYTDRSYGNGRWTYAPDLSVPGWERGLAEPPAGLAAGKLQPAAAGRPGSAAWHFRTPYIVADAEVRLKAFRKGPEDAIRLLLSVDDGRTWKRVWECPEDKTGEVELAAPVCDKFKVTATAKPPEGFNSPFGRYAYRLKLELVAKKDPADCRVDSIAFDTVVQQNFYALPQLQPGKNQVTVNGQLAAGAALQVTYVWDDPAGQGRKNVTVVEKAPWSYEIVAAGKKWEDCFCKAILVEAVPATGKGNRTEVKEAPAEFGELPAPAPTAATRGRRGWWMRVEPKKLRPVADLVKDLEDPGKQDEALHQLIEHRSAQAFDALRKLAYESRSEPVKRVAIVTLFNTDREKARPVLLDILASRPDAEGQSKVAWTDKPVKKGPQNAAEHWAETALLVGVLAREAGWKEFVPGLLRALEDKERGKNAPAHALLRVLAGLPDAGAAGAVRKALAGKDAYASAYAALAAAAIGDRAAVPAVRALLGGKFRIGQEYAALALGRLGDAESAPALRAMLASGDENLRASAAEALGEMRDAGSLGALRAALAAEPFPWVREKLEQAIAKLGGNGK